MKRELSIQLDKRTADHSPKKFVCPSCNKKQFVKFYNFETNAYLDDHFGRCDREERCGYYLSPYDQLKEQSQLEARSHTFIPVAPAAPLRVVYNDILIKTLTAYDQNTFVQFLISKLGVYRAMSLVFDFYIGTAKNNGTIFWQVDQFLRCRTGQKIHYKQDGHRDKAIEPKRLFLVKDDYRPCLFGEHQLFTKSRDALIGIVESEKTAVIATAYMSTLNNRQILWLASSGSNGLVEEKIQCLRGREIILVPDFSFHARATWGQVPMRKKLVEKETAQGVKSVRVPHPDGELQEDYISAKMKLESIGCKVSFYDPAPDTDDGSDIGDIFAELLAPIHIDMPDFSQFDLNKANSMSVKLSEKSEVIEHKFILSTTRRFKIDDMSSEYLSVTVEPHALKNQIEKFINNPSFRQLIEKFDLCDEGTVGPLKK